MTKQYQILKQYRILYVDDDETIVELMTNQLQKAGYIVHSFTSPATALDEFKKNISEYDVVISDLIMRELRGDKLAKGILEARPDMPVMILSGYVTESDFRYLYEIGVKKIVSKPNTIKEFSSVINEMLEGVVRGA